MGFVDTLLNLAGLLLWLNWLAVRFDPLSQPMASTLAGTLKRADTVDRRRFGYLVALMALLLIRPGFYHHLGAVMDWTPSLNLGVMVIPFRCDYAGRILLFSFVSFLHLLGLFYLTLLFISLANRTILDPDPFLRMARLYLNAIWRWHWAVLVAMPFGIVAACWLALYPLLVWMDLLPRCDGVKEVLLQSVRITLGAWLFLRYVIGVVLLAHVINNYVFLGHHQILPFITNTAKNLLRPFRWMPLKFGRADFTPVAVMILVFVLGEAALVALSGYNPLAGLAAFIKHI